MDYSRREWMLAVGALPLEFSALEALTRPRTPPTLPDKASFPDVRGTYLNSAATHPRSAGSTGLVRKLLASQTGGTDAYRPNERTIREHFARLVNAEPSEITFVPSTQIGEAFVAQALGLPERGAHVVSDHLHFVGSQMMYTDWAKRGLDVTWVKMKDHGIPMDELDRAIVKGRTRLVAVSATSFVTGFRHDLRRVSEIAHAKGAFVYADIIQAAGNTPLDLRGSGVDAACCATYKWLMSAGTAFLYVRRESQSRLLPTVHHHSQFTTLPTTHMYPFDTPAADIVDSYTPREGAAGLFGIGYTVSPITLAGLDYSLPYVLNLGVANIQAHAKPLIDRLKAEVPRRGYPLLTPLDATSPIVSFAVENAERLQPALNAANVRVTLRWNHLRVGTSVFNDMEDIERLLAALPKA